MESQSVNIGRYLEQLEIHHTPNKVDLIPSPYPKRFSPIPNLLDVGLKDKTENIPYISTSLNTLSRNLIQDNFSENNNTSRNSNKPHSQPTDSFIDLLIEGEETVLSAVTSENVTVATALQQDLETRHLSPINLIPFDGNPLNWPEFIQNFKERAPLKKTFSDNMRMERLLSVLKGGAKNYIVRIGTNGLFDASALKSLKRDFGDPLVVTHLKLKSVFDKPQIKSLCRTALREFQQSLKCVITWLEAMGYSFSLTSTEHLTKAVKRLPNFLRHSIYKYCNPIKRSIQTKTFIH